VLAPHSLSQAAQPRGNSCHHSSAYPRRPARRCAAVGRSRHAGRAVCSQRSSSVRRREGAGQLGSLCNVQHAVQLQTSLCTVPPALQ
jgi:hypothetical protein